MKSLVKSSLILLALQTLGMGCGSSGSHGDKKRNPVLVQEAPVVKGLPSNFNLHSSPSDLRLVGYWRSACLENSDGSSALYLMDILSSHMSLELTLYLDHDCRVPAMETKFIYSYQATIDSLTTTLAKTYVKVKNAQFTRAAEAVRSCGFNRWRTDIWYDLTDQTCKRGEGVWVEPTKSNTRTKSSLSLVEKDFEIQLHLPDLVLTRALSEDDKTRLFVDPGYHTYENALKEWGCTISKAFGISNCPTPTTLEEADQLIMNIYGFGMGIWNDPRFKANKDLQRLLENGYDAEVSKVKAFPPYAAVLKTLEDDLRLLQEAHSDFNIICFTNQSAVRAIKPLHELRAAFEDPRFDEQVRRLNIKQLMIYGGPSYYKPQGVISLSWGYETSTEDMIKYLKNRIPLEPDI